MLHKLVKYDNIIPIELINFEGIISNNKTTLTWTTITESNNNGFVVQRKYSNSDSWEDLGFVEGRGNSTNIIHYSYIDFINEFGIYFYRLKQVDYDGTYTWSNEIEIAFLNPLKFEVYQNFPNPFNPRTIVRVLLPESSYIKVNVYNLLGELVNKIVDRYYEAGIVDISIDANGIPSGIYLYQVVSRSANGQVNSKTKKMLIIK